MVLLEDVTRNKVHRQTVREHLLAPSRSRRYWIVLELQTQGDERVEAFSVSGWLERKAAERWLLELEREERWLDAESCRRMRAGQTLRMGELRWQSS